MFSGRSGQALVLVLLMTTFIFMIGGAALALGTTVRRSAALDVFQKKAYYVAEAGVEKVLARARSDQDWARSRPFREENYEFNQDDPAEKVLENVNYPDPSSASSKIKEVRVVKIGEDAGENEVKLKIRSVGACVSGSNEYNKTLTAVVSIKYPKPVFKNVAIYSESVVDMDKGLKVTGNVFCRGDLRLTSQGNSDINKTEISGNIYFLGGNLTTVGQVGFTGTIFTDDLNKVKDADLRAKSQVLSASAINALMPVAQEFCEHGLLTPEKLEWYKNNADFYNVLPSDMKFSMGVYYFDSDIEISGTYSGNAVLVVNGEVRITDELVREEVNKKDHCLTILATKKIYTPQKANVTIEALLYSNESVEFKNKVELHGSVISKAIGPYPPPSNHGHIRIFYDDNMANQNTEILSSMGSIIKITKWSS